MIPHPRRIAIPGHPSVVAITIAVAAVRRPSIVRSATPRYRAAVTEVPTWLRWLIEALIPVVTAVVGITTVTVNAETSRREEAMRLLRWAGEQAVDPGSELADVMGLQALIALDESGFSKEDHERLLWAVTQARARAIRPSNSKPPTGRRPGTATTPRRKSLTRNCSRQLWSGPAPIVRIVQAQSGSSAILQGMSLFSPRW